MSRYIVWDAAKELGSVWEYDKDYNTGKYVVRLDYENVKPSALIHMMCGSYGYQIVSPSKWAEMVKDAKTKNALADPEASLEAVVPIMWVAKEDEKLQTPA